MLSSVDARCSTRSRGSPRLASLAQDAQELQQQRLLREAEERRQRHELNRRSMHMETRTKSRTKAFVEDGSKSKLAPKLNHLAQRELERIDHREERGNDWKTQKLQGKPSALDLLRARAKVELRNEDEKRAKESDSNPISSVRVKRALLVRVVDRSPLKNAFQSRWEARHDVSNLDNYVRREKQEETRNNNFGNRRSKFDEDECGISISSSSDESTSDSSDEDIDETKRKIAKRGSKRDDSIFIIYSQRPFNSSRNESHQGSKAIDIRF